MSLFKGPDGYWHADVRVVGMPRWHGSMRTKKKAEAQPRYDAVRRLFREAKGPNGADRRLLVDDLLSGAFTVERLETMVASSEPLVRSVKPTGGPALPTVDIAMQSYLGWIKRNPTRRHATWEAARAHLRRFAACVVDGVRLGSVALDAITSAQVEAYQQSLIDAGAAANTITGYMARVGALYKWMQRQENRAAVQERRVPALIHCPVDPETTSRETTRRDRWLTKDEATSVLEVTPDRLRFAVAAGIFGGFRIGEILHLRTHVDVDLDLETIAVTQKKWIGPDGEEKEWKPKTKRAERVVPIAPDLKPILIDHIARFASADWLMPAVEDPTQPFNYNTFGVNFTTIVENAELVAGRTDPRGVVAHTLRHTFASWLVMAGIDLYTVAQLLGDTLQMVERTYAHLAPDFKRRAIEALKGAIVVPPPLGFDRDTAKETATQTATTTLVRG